MRRKCRVCYKEVKKGEEYWKLNTGSLGQFTHSKCRKSTMPEFTTYYVDGKLKVNI